MIAETQFTVEDFRKRIQAMSDERLLRYGKAERYMADPRNSADKHSVRPVYVAQLQLCREEWLRRHPKRSVMVWGLLPLKSLDGGELPVYVRL